MPLYKQCKGSPTCRNKTTSGYCEKHKAPDYETTRESGYKRYDAKWQKRRDLFIKQNPLCSCKYQFCCGEKGCRNLATEVDHRLPKSMGGEDYEINLRSSCSYCHGRKTRYEQRLMKQLYGAAAKDRQQLFIKLLNEQDNINNEEK